ncbi:MAG: FtsB/FtsL family cell division protein [Planctomycetota bacterium]|jgi:hypothetical protein
MGWRLAVPGALFLVLGSLASHELQRGLFIGGVLLFVGIVLTAAGVMVHVDHHARGLAGKLDDLRAELALLRDDVREPSGRDDAQTEGHG